ncbi:Gfo/Idh/MocA family protein [Goodfellowiella coeruleoviolacea]|uniref:Dehydrogenase n=1 Tax=Goodfellowiella coeruleoviolacea TaxID=334858 RepID=A0AAE3GLE1_9PSEU|nr:Gfo/Idh/MocA family oxidoreductase [Goodfellowiella coeruleoviolacea]MCP2170417.1 putative dehydrogenase [Goodfellowiella coeruleoviolacea]
MTTQSVAAPPKCLCFGVLGCADIAWRRMLPTLVAADGVRVVAVASRDHRKAARFADRFGCDAENYTTLLDRSDVDAVYLPLPTALHADWAARALEAGKHVLAEKPLTRCHREAAALVRLAERRGLVLMENFMFLHHSQHRVVAELLAGHVIGELRGFSSTFTIPPKPGDDIRYRPVLGDGALDFGVYPIRAAHHYLGPDLTVVGAVLRRERQRDVIISGDVLLCNAEGIPAQLRFGMDHSYRTGYELAGSTGRLTLDRAFTTPASLQPVIRIERQDYREERALPVDDQFANIVDYFVRAVRDGADTSSWTEATLRQSALVDKVLETARIVDYPASP